MNTEPYNNSFSGLATAAAPINIDLVDDLPIAERADLVSLEAVRYLFFPGDLMTPSQKRERIDLRTGGEYLGQGYKTLIRSRGLLRRCQITPMEPALDFMSSDMMGDDPRLKSVVTLNHGGGAAGQLNGIRVYPGDEIAGLLGVERQNSKGIVELTQLAGMEVQEVRESGIQTFVFPEWAEIMAGYKTLPIKLSELRTHIESRQKETSDESIKTVIDQMLSACEQYYVWGHNYLKTASTLVKQAGVGGFVHTYGELAEQLFIQLEIRREDLLTKDQDIADIVARASQGNNVSNGEMMQVLKMLADNQAALTQMLGGKSPVVTEPAQETEVRLCGQPKANGEPCSRTLEDGQIACFQHAPKEEIDAI